MRRDLVAQKDDCSPNSDQWLGSCDMTADDPVVVPTAAPVLYFASGSNQPVEISGFARIGHAVGVSAAHLAEAGEAALHALAGSGVPVFLDSGAFSEADFPDDGPPIIVRPMTREQWLHVVALGTRLARSLGSQLHVVAPDCIGDQDETLRRLKRYAGAYRQIRELGAHVIVPIQRGGRPQADFDRACADVLGFDDFVRGIPLKKKATSLSDLKRYVAAVRPARIHMLGMGPRNRSFDRFAAAATKYGATLSCDSCLITSSVGRRNGRKNHPAERFGGRRVYTKAQDLAREIIAAGLSDITEPRELAIPLAFAPIADEAARWALTMADLRAWRESRVQVA